MNGSFFAIGVDRKKGKPSKECFNQIPEIGLEDSNIFFLVLVITDSEAFDVAAEGASEKAIGKGFIDGPDPKKKNDSDPIRRFVAEEGSEHEHGYNN